MRMRKSDRDKSFKGVRRHLNQNRRIFLIKVKSEEQNRTPTTTVTISVMFFREPQLRKGKLK